MKKRSYPFAELDQSAEAAAKRLLGCELERTFDDGQVALVRIVETEAYDEADPGSHSSRGRTPRTEVMFGPAGYVYVYFTYGMHYCANIVVGSDGHGEAVLIRAVEPIDGEELLKVRRPGQSGIDLTNGPSKFCKALDIDKALYGHDLRRRPLRLIMKPPLDDEHIVQTTRVGLTHGTETPWRFYIRDNPYVSKK